MLSRHFLSCLRVCNLHYTLLTFTPTPLLLLLLGQPTATPPSDSNAGEPRPFDYLFCALEFFFLEKGHAHVERNAADPHSHHSTAYD